MQPNIGGCDHGHSDEGEQRQGEREARAHAGSAKATERDGRKMVFFSSGNKILCACIKTADVLKCDVSHS